MCYYDTADLPGIDSKAKENFHLFNIDCNTCMKIIHLGIRKQHRPYRQSRAGTSLFQRILTTISTTRYHTATTEVTSSRMIDTNNLVSITLIKLFPKLKQVKLAHINARSISNKIQPFQEYITRNGEPSCCNRNMGKSRSSIASIRKFHHQTTKSLIPPELVIDLGEE